MDSLKGFQSYGGSTSGGAFPLILAPLVAKLKYKFSPDVEENANRLHFLIVCNFVIHPQILIFGVFKSESFSILSANKIFHVTVHLLIYFYHQFVPALKKTLRQ